MKLYTEKQIREAFFYGINCTYRPFGKDDDFIKKLTPIIISDEHIVDTNEMTSPQTEISDEDIYKEAEYKSKIFRGWTIAETSVWVMACQWYREQLKNKQ